MIAQPAKRFWIVLLLMVSAGASWWMSRSSAPESLSSDAEARHEPDYYMEQFELTSLDALGKPAYRLDADNMLHYPADDSATLERPHLLVFRSDREFWDIRAESGLVSSGGEEVTLQGEVIILRVNADDPRALEVHTSNLLVRPHAKYAETAAAVTIRDQNGVTRAVGMTADLNLRRVELLSNVRGDYVPQYH